MGLRDQWEAERAIWPEGPAFFDYARQVARSGWFFGGRSHPVGGARLDLVTEARQVVEFVDGRAPSRWVVSGKTTPSGKTILRCSGCGFETPLPSRCPARCTDAEVARGWSRV
jgi:hypothetical protein